MILWQLATGGKFHAPELGSTTKTACNSRIPMTANRRDADLVDSGDKCRDPRCLGARGTRS